MNFNKFFKFVNIRWAILGLFTSTMAFLKYNKM